MNEMVPREAFGLALAELGEKYDFLVLDGDLSKATRSVYLKEKFINRHLNIGIAESNMMGIAAGIASTGQLVVACTFAMFAAGRAFEQVRNSIAYPALNVKIVGTHGGISIGEDGASHQCIEDISLMRTLPNMTVISPADAYEIKPALEAALQINGPVYFRIYGKGAWPVIFHPENHHFEPGKAVLVKDGNDVTLAATGVMTGMALQASEILLTDGIHARVLNFHTIKPIDRDAIIKAAHETGAIVSAEDHNVIGGLGSAIAEVLVEEYPVSQLRVGLPDTFGRSGKPLDLFRYFKMTPGDIASRAKEAIQKKSTRRQ
jgi:transketolase